MLAATIEKILQFAGKYFYSPNILDLTEAIKQKKSHIASANSIYVKSTSICDFRKF